MTYVTHAELAAADGAELVGSQLPASASIDRTVQNRLSDRISLLDFIPVALHADIRDRQPYAADLSSYVQAALDDVAPGATLYAPSGIYRLELPVVAENSVTLCGDPGRETMDNSWDYGDSGTIFDYRGTTGTAFTFTAPANSGRVNVVLRDFLVRGSLITEQGMSGNCIEVRGDDHVVAVRVLIDNVHCCEAPEHGLCIHTAVYGGTIDNFFGHRNGKNGLRMVAGNAVGVGEFRLGRIRCFDNGHEGTGDQEKAGVLWLGGTLRVDQMSSSESAGAGLIFGGGPAIIDMLQLESNEGSASLIVGQPDAGVQSLTINCLHTAPGTAFTGQHVRINSNAHRVQIHGGFLGDTLGLNGCHIFREAGSQELIYDGLGSTAPLVIKDQSDGYGTHQIIQVYARQQAAGALLTGDGTDVFWAPDTEVLDNRNTYDVATGIFTAPVTGLYDIEAVITLVGLNSAHDRAAVMFGASSGNHVYRIGNVGAMRDASNQFVLQARARLPLQQGETARVAFNVGGGAPTVGFLGGGETGFLSVVTAH